MRHYIGPLGIAVILLLKLAEHLWEAKKALADDKAKLRAKLDQAVQAHSVTIEAQDDGGYQIIE